MHGAALLGASVVAVGCGPSVPDLVVYRVLVEDGASLQGVPVARGGQVAGTLSAAGAVELTMPSAVRPSALGLTLAVATQCGPRAVPLELQLAPDADTDESIGRQMADDRVVLVRARAGVGALARAKVLVDRGNDPRPLRVGEGVVTGGPEASLFVAECGTSAPVRVGDEVIGTWHASSAATFVSLEPTCHVLSPIGYGDAVTGRPILFGQRVRSLQKAPEHFLTPAPESVRAARYEGARYVTELTRAPCPAGPPASQVAVEVMARGGCLEAIPSLRRATEFDQDDVASAVQLAVCLAHNVESEGIEVARSTLAIHPEARERFVAAFGEAELAQAASSL